MKSKLLLLIKKHTDTLIEQTRTKPQETLDFVMNKQTHLNLIEEDKWLLAVPSFECTNSAFIIIDENNSFSFTIPCQWDSEDGEELINEINKLLELRSENDIELHVKEVEERGTRIEIEISGYNLAGFDHFKNEFLSELKRLIYRDLKDMVHR